EPPMKEPQNRIEPAGRGFPASSRSRPAEAEAADPRIEDYLDRVCAPLVEIVSYETRQELRAELRAHLESLVASYLELGSDPGRAVTVALRQVGNARLVADRYAELSAGVSPPGASLSAWAGVLAAFLGFSLLGPLLEFPSAFIPEWRFGNHSLLWDI